jgi:hypothetical protein
VIAAAALLLLAVMAAAIFFLWRSDPDLLAPIDSAAPPAPPPPPALTIHGITLTDGPVVDPTDVMHLVQAHIAGKEATNEAQLLSITIQRANHGKVDLDDERASITYEYLLIRRDPLAEVKRERVTLTLRKDPPPVTRSAATGPTKTVHDPICVWSTAWRAATASGLPKTEPLDASYGPDPKGRHPVWIFTVPGRDSIRAVDGRTCAIKSSQRTFTAPTVLLPSEAGDGAIYVDPSDAR